MSVVKPEWDVALSPHKLGASLHVGIPAAIAAVLIERGMFRAKLAITDEGLLLTPYVASTRKKEPGVDLPDWGKA